MNLGNLNMDDGVSSWELPPKLMGIPTAGVFKGVSPVDMNYVGIQIMETKERETTKNFFKFICPCGVTDSYAMNSLSEVDTRMSCGVEDHWVIRFKDVA